MRRLRIGRSGGWARPRLRVRRTRLAELELSSTSDIAFLLLIFFLSTAVFASQSGLSFLLPPAGRAPVARADASVLVRLDAAGGIAADGAAVTAHALTGWARERLAQAPDRLFIVEVDPRCPYEELVAALDALRRAAVRRVSFRGAAT